MWQPNKLNWTIKQTYCHNFPMPLRAGMERKLYDYSGYLNFKAGVIQNVPHTIWFHLRVHLELFPLQWVWQQILDCERTNGIDEIA